MSELTIDLNILAQETLELSENLRKEIYKKRHFDGEYNQGDLFVFDDFDRSEELIVDEFWSPDAEQADVETGEAAQCHEECYEECQEEARQEHHEVRRTVFAETFEEPVIEVAPIESEEEDFLGENLPEGPGIIYRLEKGISTFCVRGVVSEDLAYDLEQLSKNDQNLVKKLKIREEEDFDAVSFLPMDDIALAETIVDQLVNRRFPREEAMLCNLSDPGFSWWLDEGENDFKIYFQSHGIERDRALIQLGPLGDPMIAYRRLSRALGTLKEYFPINEYSATEKSFIISTAGKGNETFQKFRGLFMEGDFFFEDFDPTKRDEKQTLMLYLRELAALRKFWLYIEEELQ